MLEITLHDGPGRLGKYEGAKTPSTLKTDDSLPLLKDEPMPYNVPKALAEWSVNQTVENARKTGENGIAVIHGSKYPDLRVKCAQELEELGNSVFMVANSEELMRRPMDLVEMMVKLREALNPNSAIYFPFTDVSFIPLLAYLGVDLFSEDSCEFYAKLNTMLTPTTRYDTESYVIYEMEQEELVAYNKNSMDFVLREVRENIKNGTLRNLVEERCCTSPEAMTALRILDRDHPDFLERYTQMY
ncbi:archaeosine tRNA-ribosyltransferase [Methanobacterium aggregans]|uniref:archaeosine tRNA-ribosyltransferase n=1 Tax=Methanobacterium aggregans TaxID=1615586 RepID=UPI001AE27C3A|nr:archaeosine tRNA-ribosyltransferase [Methanobacterium aggregans]MBP2044813.1 putative RNA-binding protein [Methanobacterium aggregans]